MTNVKLKEECYK